MPKAGKRGADDALGAKGGRGSSRGKQQKTAIAAAKAAQTSAPVPASNGSDLVNLIPIRNVKESADEDCLNEVLLSKTEKAPQIVLSEDRLSASSRKGYRMVRATHGVAYGSWYFEVLVKHLGATGHCRLGWSTERGELQAPVGYDDRSFSYRDINGSKVHKARRAGYGSAYVEGDVIGCLIQLPKEKPPKEAPKEREKALFRGRLFYVEEIDKVAELMPGTRVVFFKNGACQGLAFEDLREGKYFPAASLFTHPSQEEPAEVTFNFGPDFKFAPQGAEYGAVRPMSEVLVEQEAD
mmetsp:Transcript_11604/g.42437  ORF Transcript_11604/g.42437 Transcript_11604/m.42437 type:complete len:296 (-) Transcript_11604:123-1010(-)